MSRDDGEKRGSVSRVSAERTSDFVFGPFWVIVFIATLCVAGPWAGYHGVLLASVGLLVLLRPPAVALPRTWWILAAVFLLAGSAVFLPASWFGIPGWRSNLEGLGVNTGTQVVIQARQAAEGLGLFGMTLFIGLWLAGHRPSTSQGRTWALAFAAGVAIYAILSKIIQSHPHAGQGEGLYGFFPNRNHTATYLAMGVICGLGCVLQAVRDRKFPTMAIALAATAVCLWAVAGWSLSRGGVVLVAVGSVLWLATVGPRYLGSNGLRAMILILLTGVGLFFIADSAVKDRISKTVEKASGQAVPSGENTPVDGSTQNLDFRIPVAMDTFGLIRASLWTGIGPGQFYYIFPQFRHRTLIANDTDAYHPESDWLWMAAETGVPATLALVTLVLLAAWKSLASIRAGRERAVRGACLVAALLVAIHGIFDVPGHRIPLALSAAFLFALSQRPSPATKSPPSWPFRLGGLAMLACGGFLLAAQWGSGPQPATLAGPRAVAQATELMAQDESNRKVAEKSGKEYSLPASEDPLEKALSVLGKASVVAPLQRNLYRLQGFVALHFDDKDALAARAFQIERALQPKRVNVPFEQGRAWEEANPDQTVSLWQESLARARQLDLEFADSQWSERKMRERILAEMAGKTAVQDRWKRSQDQPSQH